jgi:aryl-alcohol dehydrogenase-like predicted oxidoreductase
MEHLTLPGTVLNISNICLGTGEIGGKIDKAASYKLLDLFIGEGGNFIDTAKVYSDWIPNQEKSISEKTIGGWVALRRNRERVVLATKGGHPNLETMHIPRLSPEEIRSDLENSLRNLKTEIIDLYWLHRDDPKRPVNEVIDCLNGLVQEEKIRYFGCSNWTARRIRAADTYAQVNGKQGFTADQMFWNVGRVDKNAIGDPTLVQMDTELFEYHREAGFTAIPYSSQAGGLFTKLQSTQPRYLRQDLSRVYPLEVNLPVFQEIRVICMETGFMTTQVVLGYLLSQPFTTVPIIGSQNPEQLRDSLNASEVRLTAEQVKRLMAWNL